MIITPVDAWLPFCSWPMPPNAPPPSPIGGMHARCTTKEERQAVERIEKEEWKHRRLLGEMLKTLGSGPHVWREWVLLVIGRILGLLCQCSGWYLLMYGAGAIQSQNVNEYVEAGRLATIAGYAGLAVALTAMATCEREHEV